jgi:hypothetical protein
MSIPASYTETTLATYMHTILGPVAATLGWSVAAGSYDEPVNEALAAYGVDDIADISGRANITKLRALARREVWRAVMQATASHYDVKADGANRSRSQIHTQAKAAYELACIDALSYDPAYIVGVTTVDYADPYLPPNPYEDDAT